MTELLNGRPTPRTQCFHVGSSQGAFPLVFLSISRHTLIYEAVLFSDCVNTGRIEMESDSKETLV